MDKFLNQSSSCCLVGPSLYISVGKISLFDNVKYINAGDQGVATFKPLFRHLYLLKVGSYQSCLMIY